MVAAAGKTDRRRAYEKAWRQKNADKLRAYSREYQKEWRRKHADRLNAEQREWRRNNPGREKESARKWREANRDRVLQLNRKSLLKNKYGMTPEDWQTMFDAQGRVCGCCGSDDPKAKNGWQTDHCHDTGVVRGIVCMPCNLMIGHAANDPAVLMKAAKYLMLV